MPRVLFIIPHLSNSMRLLADYLRYLDPRFRVTLFILEEDRRFEHEFPHDARKVFHPPASRIKAIPSQLRALLREAKQQDLIVSWMELTPTYLAALVGMLRRKPVISWNHAHLSRVFALKQRPGRLHRPLMRFFYPRVAAAVGCSEGVGRDLQEHFGFANASAIPNGVDVERCRRLSHEPVPERLRHIFDKPVIINVAALHFQKNQQLLLRAHARLVREGVAHNLLFVGSGPLEDELRRQIAELGIVDSTFFSGFIDNPYPLIRQSHAFVLSSHWEGLPLVVAEALAIGAAVISTDCPSGPREILDGGKYGLLIPVDDLDALSGAIREVLTDESRRDELRRLSSEGAERMSIIPRARQLGDLLWDVLRSSGYATPDTQIPPRTAELATRSS